MRESSWPVKVVAFTLFPGLWAATSVLGDTYGLVVPMTGPGTGYRDLEPAWHLVPHGVPGRVCDR